MIPRTNGRHAFALSEQEKRLLALEAEGKTRAEIAALTGMTRVRITACLGRAREKIACGGAT